MDGVADGGWCGHGVLTWMVYEWEMEGEVRGTMFLGRACLKYGKVMKLAPV